MVDQTHIRSGIDIVGSDYLIAQVEREGQNFRVLALSNVSQGELTNSLLSESCSLVIAVSDEDVIFKNLSIPSDSSSGKSIIARFEFENSLLDKPTDFCFDAIDSNQNSRALCMVARKSRLEIIQNSLCAAENYQIRPEGYMARSIALGRGFVRFCSNDTERMVCLADFSCPKVSIAFVLRNQVVALAEFDRSQFDLNSETGILRISSELKTIMNFRLSELADWGITVEMTRLILTGRLFSAEQKEAIASRLEVELEEPAMYKVLTDKPLVDSDLPMSSYLVALGLTSE